eukprot:RCo052055
MHQWRRGRTVCCSPSVQLLASLFPLLRSSSLSHRLLLCFTPPFAVVYVHLCLRAHDSPISAHLSSYPGTFSLHQLHSCKLCALLNSTCTFVDLDDKVAVRACASSTQKKKRSEYG